MTSKCTVCGKMTIELCGDLVCRECHVSLSFEDCCDGTWAARLDLANGVSYEMAKEMHPNARI